MSRDHTAGKARDTGKRRDGSGSPDRSPERRTILSDAERWRLVVLSMPQLKTAYRSLAFDDERSIRDDVLQAASIELFHRLRYFDPDRGVLPAYVKRWAGQIFAKVVPKVRWDYFQESPAYGGPGDVPERGYRPADVDRLDLVDFVRSFPLVEREIVFGSLHGETIRESCRRIGIDRKTYYRRRESAGRKIRQLFGRS